MRVGRVGGPISKCRIAGRIRKRAIAALEKSDLSDVLELAGAEDADRTATAAMKAVLAERVTEYAIKAMKEAKKRGTKIGAATIIIAAEGSR